MPWSRDEGARAIGRAYLEGEPGERDPAQLAARLAESLGGGAPWSRDDVLARVRRDYDEERVVLVRGWLLSRTEARLCALASLGDAPGSARE